MSLICTVGRGRLSHDPVTVEVASRYLKELQEKDVDTLILGCTHYPLLRSTIGQIMGEGVTLVNPAYETALELGRLLKEQDMQSTGQGQSDFPISFLCERSGREIQGLCQFDSALMWRKRRRLILRNIEKEKEMEKQWKKKF